ncbi:MAG: hypothetical protein A2Y54_09450 [Chloroflexi bacterium RBG_16_51_16]|nr:MAG: hypothetical protein A2Y54_09450 [Chloroflexi bacterium RBG_16_51_16]
MSILWYKIWSDLWHNKTRTALAVLSIAAGVFAVGAIFGMSDLLMVNLDEAHHEVIPPHIDMAVTTPVDLDVLLNLRDVPGVENIEPYNSVTIQYKTTPDGSWRQGVIHMRGEFNDQQYELVQLRQGHWPHTKDEIGVERMAAEFLKVGVGDSIIIKVHEKERTYPITSLIRHPFVPPPQFMDLAFFFMSGDGLESFDIPDGKFQSFFIRVTPYSPEFAREVASAIKEKLAKQNIEVAGVMYQDPEEHWGRAFFESMTMVQKMLAILCVVISAILVYNTLFNIITQQINQIGILKAIGSKSGTIIQIYLISAFLYGVLALLIALPLGALVASEVTDIFLRLFNIDTYQFEISQQTVVYQVASALIAPLLAGLPPTLRGASISVREAIASYGLGGGFRSTWLDRIAEKIGQRFLPSHYATALGNMLRHKGRLFLTQAVLICAGSGFLIVMSLVSSLNLTLDNYFSRLNYDTVIVFNSNQRVGRVNSYYNQVAEADQVELRMLKSAILYLEGQRAKEAGIGIYLEGIPSSSDFFEPLIVAGRWLKPGDGRVLVVSRDFSEKNNLQPGKLVRMDLGNFGESEWQVIGTYEPVFVGSFNQEIIYTSSETLSQVTKKFKEGTYLYVRTDRHGQADVKQITEDLTDLFNSHNMDVSISQTSPDLRNTYQWQFNTVIFMLLGLSIIVALVGGLALMGALSIGVIERTKEIGVLRAVGARSRSILGLFVMEGLFQGWISWLASIPVALIISPIVSVSLGQTLFGATLDYQYNWGAVVFWLVVVTVISLLASILPARRATHISVRDSLAYA